MNVKELIKQLQTYPDNMDILIRESNGMHLNLEYISFGKTVNSDTNVRTEKVVLSA